MAASHRMVEFPMSRWGVPAPSAAVFSHATVRVLTGWRIKSSLIIICAQAAGAGSFRTMVAASLFLPILPMNEFQAICAEACRQCIAACETCSEQLARVGGGAAARSCMEFCQACVRLCTLVVEELKFSSAFLTRACALCAVICRSCAEECQAYGDAACRACAEACLDAAAKCHAVATKNRSQVSA
jgi:hypothetical protein